MSNKPLDAGPELDAAVARALGWDFTITADGDVMLLGEQAPFKPSRRIEIAFEAAEDCDLFVFGETAKDGSRFLDKVIDGGVVRWRICQHEYDLVYGHLRIAPIATGSTPSEAICRAIDFLSKKKPSP